MNDSEPVSFTIIARAIVERRHLCAATVLSGCAISLILAFMIPKVYTSEAVILPSGESGPLGTISSALDAMNLDLGMDVSPDNSIFFPVVMSSSVIRNRLLDSRISLDNDSLTVGEALGEGSRGNNLEKLNNYISILTERKTGIIRVRATTGDPELSLGLVERLVGLLKEFNLAGRRERTSKDLEYITGELDSAGIDLRKTEENLTRYEKSNRNCFSTTDPGVIMEHERLVRDLRLKQDIYIDLVKKRELADIERIRENGSVRMLDAPDLPLVKSGPPRKMIALAGGLLSLLAGIAIPVFGAVSPLSIIRYYFTD